MEVMIVCIVVIYCTTLIGVQVLKNQIIKYQTDSRHR